MQVAIIGGGIMGVSAAFWLTRGADPPGVTIIERDPSLATSSTMLSAASIRQQFGTPANIRASRFGWAFLCGARESLGVEVGLKRRGYLTLATEGGAARLAALVALQNAEGAATILLDPGEIAARFPWIATEGVAAGALGQDEGWFDPAALHAGFLAAARAAGARTATGEAAGLRLGPGGVRAVRLAAGGEIAADVVVNAAGARAGAVAAMAGQSLPVRPDIRTVFVLDVAEAEGIAAAAPLLVDPAGFWMRPEGRGFIAGMASPVQPADPWSLPVDWPLFEAALWPMLAARVPVFERLRPVSAWAGAYDWNEWDQNALLGADPACPNLFHIAGFSGHGLQQAPAMGRALAELVLTGGFRTLDLSDFAVTRIAGGRRVVEEAVI